MKNKIQNLSEMVWGAPFGTFFTNARLLKSKSRSKSFTCSKISKKTHKFSKMVRDALFETFWRKYQAVLRRKKLFL